MVNFIVGKGIKLVDSFGLSVNVHMFVHIGSEKDMVQGIGSIVQGKKCDFALTCFAL